jgi:hypothetical protein
LVPAPRPPSVRASEALALHPELFQVELVDDGAEGLVVDLAAVAEVDDGGSSPREPLGCLAWPRGTASLGPRWRFGVVGALDLDRLLAADRIRCGAGRQGRAGT